MTQRPGTGQEMNTLYSRRTRFDDTRPRAAIEREALEDWTFGPVRYVCSNTIADWMDYEDEYDDEYEDCYDV